MKVGNKRIGKYHPCYIIADAGINHNGDVQIAKQLMEAAKRAGCDAVKFQKRTVEVCVPEHMRDRVKETPWGNMVYMEYKKRLEFGNAEYEELFAYAKSLDIDMFVSVWDAPSVVFMEKFSPIAYKIPSAMFTNKTVMDAVLYLERPTFISVGGADWHTVERAVGAYSTLPNVAVLQCTAAYPCPDEYLNLKVITALKKHLHPMPVGYSGHERGLATSVAAVAIGADVLERHITLDRSMWGSDQSASIEPHGFKQLVRDVRAVELAMGDGVKVFYDIEKPSMESLRWHTK